MKTSFQSILIYGLGLMGGSIAMSLKKKHFKGKITGILRTQSSLEEAKSLNITDELILEKKFLLDNRWNEFDFIIFALPIDLTCSKIDLIPDDYTGLITDLGSTKKKIIEKVESKFSKVHNYLSSHPMTGSEHSGAKFGTDSLFEGKLCILTSPNLVKETSKKTIDHFWQELGSTTVEIEAKDHDEVLAYLSHSPHILSSLLAKWSYGNRKVMEYTESSPLSLTGGGFRDMTRIAGSNPEMWEAIITSNRTAIHRSLKEFQARLSELVDVFELPESQSVGFWEKYFEEAKKSRNKILKQ
ncbi:MAG: prephenate dehydrogenase/arogenate dehydrogenase family protein [Leptospiraceae bacterium]|nr:prephenate dehydrogenase/arogenate dehydrogenase family protein [Leptospiraceae bacterium]